MKNKLNYIFLIFIFNYFINFNANGADIFNFDVTELEIIEEGNKFIGKNGGTVTSEDGTVIKAKNFEYDKIKNILIAFGNVEIIDKKENIIIKSQKITYLKNDEFLFTSGKSKATSDGIVIDADNFEYNKIKNIINAYGNVKIDNLDENYVIFTDEATYQKNKELFITKGKSKAINEGIIIDADNFEYNKSNNVINANGNVAIDNKDENYLIYADDATYLKNEQLFLTKGHSKAINEDIVINGDNFEYNRIDNTINAEGNVKIEDTLNDYLILTNEAKYYKNSEKVITQGETKADIQSKYYITSKDVTYLHEKKIISSQNKTKLQDQKSQVYFADKFNYSINQDIIKGENFLIITNYNLP